MTENMKIIKLFLVGIWKADSGDLFPSSLNSWLAFNKQFTQ